MTDVPYREAIDAAADLLRDVYRFDVAKALDPLNARDFAVIVRRLERALAGVTREAEGAALRSALAELDVDWASLSASARDQVVRAARRAVDGIANRVLPRVEHIFEIEGQDIVTGTRRATSRRFGLHIGASTDRTDARIAAFVRASESNFIRDQYGRRSELVSVRARDIVAAGLERGLGRADITAELSATLSPVVARGKPYWEIVATSFANRARTHTQLAAFDEAAIEHYRFEAVLDEATSEVCRFMHGRTFSVSHARRRFEQVAQAPSPEAVADLQPWMRSGRDRTGNQFLYFERAGERRLVARVQVPAVGEPDRVGRYAGTLSTAQLEDAGVTVPPLHGRCRSTIVVA